MISPATGDVDFTDGLHLRAHQPASELFASLTSTSLPFPGWTQHELGVRCSEYGEFHVEIVCGPEKRLYLVMLSHQHAFYETNTTEDNERQVFHEGILAKDLRGQREFDWGQAFCRLDSQQNKNCLVIAYTTGPQVPLRAACQLLGLEEVEDASE